MWVLASFPVSGIRVRVLFGLQAFLMIMWYNYDNNTYYRAMKCKRKIKILNGPNRCGLSPEQESDSSCATQFTDKILMHKHMLKQLENRIHRKSRRITNAQNYGREKKKTRIAAHSGSKCRVVHLPTFSQGILIQRAM